MPATSLAQRYERPYRVRFDEAGPDGHLRSSGYLRFAQDLAWIHSESAGFDRDWYGERGLTWLVRAVELDLVAEAAYGSEVAVSTEVVGFRRVWGRRRSEFRVYGSERPVAVAITDWVILNARGAPTRVPPEIVGLFHGQDMDFSPMRVALPETPVGARAFELSVRRSEVDPMAHVNNAVYLDYVDEHLFAGLPAHHALALPRRYRAEFVASAEPDTHLVGHGWATDLGSCVRLADDAGREMLRARIETNPATWVGG